VKFVLASNSPRRHELIHYLGIDFIVDASNIDEIIDETLSNEDVVMSLAFQKAYDVSKRYKEEYVLGFDTLVILDGKPIGKPNNREEAAIMLRALSGRKHTVLTGVAIVKGEYKDLFYDHAEVIFNEMTDQEISEYLDTGEPFDKAGSYGIQGYGSKHIKEISGDYFAIVGLPISKLYNKLKSL